DFHCLQQHIHTLVWSELSEKAETILRSVCFFLYSVKRPATVVFKPYPLRCYAPGDEAVAQEAARRQKQINEGELRLAEALAHEEFLRRDLREAFVAAA